MPEWTISGPIEGGRGQAFIQPRFDCAAAGYRQEEFLISGSAARFFFTAGTGMSPDGQWRVERGEALPYRTRLIVRRPADDSRFNGIVILIWNNVTAGYDNIRTHPLMYGDGYAIVAASVQRVGIEGFAGPDPKGLLAFDPDRYRGLSIPTDDLSYDLFTQIGEAVGPKRTGAVDPLGGLPVRHVIARGASQSANRLAAYINAAAPLGHPFSGFMLDVFMGSPAQIETADEKRPGSIDDLSKLVDGTCAPGTSRMRDIDVPVFVVNSESESRSFASVRKPDNDHFRLWEAAGLSHAGGIKVSSVFTATDLPPNNIDIQPYRDAALHWMRRWVEEGVPPPVQPRIELEPGGEGIPPRIVRDKLGIAKGGVRLPEISAPIAVHDGFNRPGWAFLRGSSRPLDPDQLSTLYDGPDDYLRRFEAATHAAVAAGVLLPAAARASIGQAIAENPLNALPAQPPKEHDDMSNPQQGLMEQRISCVNLGVEDVNRARSFYEAMGWRQSPVSRGNMPIFNANGTVFILFDRQEMAHEAFRGVGAPTEAKPVFSGITLSYVVRKEEEVQQILDRAEAHGGRIISPATKQQWGNISGYFTDPEGHVWEVSKTARTPLQADGSFRIGE